MSWGTRHSELIVFTVNCFKDSQHTFLFNIENTVEKENWKIFTFLEFLQWAFCQEGQDFLLLKYVQWEKSSLWELYNW